MGAQRVLEIMVDEVYVNTLIIKFQDHYVEGGDPLKCKALLFFKRIFNNRVRPDELCSGPQQRPSRKLCGQDGHSVFTRDFWARFWNVANNEQLARPYTADSSAGMALRFIHSQIDLPAGPGLVV